METLQYRGWLIALRAATKGFVTDLTDPRGWQYTEPLLYFPTCTAAEAYARKFIDWFTEH